MAYFNKISIWNFDWLSNVNFTKYTPLSTNDASHLVSPNRIANIGTTNT